MKNIMVFCSNPVNGGTAQIFVDVVRQLKIQLDDAKIIPCINRNNDVEIYDTIDDLKKIEVDSETTVLGKLNSAPVYIRIPRRFYRNIKYSKYKRLNIQEFCRFLVENKIDSVMIHNGGYIGDDLCNQLLIAAEKVRVKNRIMIFHSDLHKNFLRKSLCRGYDAMINRCATQTVTVSNFTRERILDSSYLNKDMKVIYNGISYKPAESIERKKAKLQYREDSFHVGMVGNFFDNKGQMHFLKSIKTVIDKSDKTIQAFIIGNIYDKEYYERCIKFIDENDLQDTVKICQGILNAKEYYELFDVTIVPSLYDESFGLISAESMRGGTPVVAYACGGIPEVVRNGVDGFIVPIGDVKGMSNAILKLIDDAELCFQMGEDAIKHFNESFKLEIMGKEYAELLQDG